MFRNGFFLSLLWIATASPLWSQNINLPGVLGFDASGSGVTTLSSLKLPISARSMAMGGRALTTDEEATMIHGDPASLALIQNYYYAFSHAEILGEFRHEDLAVTWPTNGYGNFGVFSNILTTTPFEDARDIDENPTYPSAYDLALGFAYGKMLVPGRVAMGTRLDLIRSSIAGTVANAYALNAGLLFFLVQDLSVAATVENLSHGVRYQSSTAPLEPLPLGLGLELGKPLHDSHWSAHVGTLKSNDGILKYYGGMEVLLWKYFLLRAGYEGSSQDQELGDWSGLTAGVGLKYDWLTVDYGYKSLGLLGGYHAITINYSQKANLRPRDQILLDEALDMQRQGKYAKALNLAKKAFKINPFNYQVQALISQLVATLDRLDETAFAIYYTANTNGELSSHWDGGRLIGGLARRKTKLQELKGFQGRSLILDAGNLTSPGFRPGQEKYVYESYLQMPYDAVNIGSHEVFIDTGKWNPRLPWLASQKLWDKEERKFMWEKTMSLKGGVTVKVLGALNSNGDNSDSLAGKNMDADADGLQKLITKGNSGDNTLLVLLLSGSLAYASKIALRVPQIDVMILSGNTQALGSPIKVGSTLICSPGQGGTHIGALTLFLDPKGKIKFTRHVLIPLDATVEEDKDLKKYLEPVTLDANKAIVDNYEDDYRSQVLVFTNAQTSGESSGGRLFLRDLKISKDYEVPTQGLLCSQPILAYGKNRIAFLGTDPTGNREVYSIEPGTWKMDTLSRLGGKAEDIRWAIGNNALFAVYTKDGHSDLYRIDPWNHEVRNLSQGRFGKVIGFDINKAGDRLAVNCAGPDKGTIWVTGMDMENPMEVASGPGFLGRPQWSPQGNRLGFLALANAADASGAHPTGELHMFDFGAKKLIPVTLGSHVQEFSWAESGRKMYYVAGVNLLDINEIDLESMGSRKVTDAGAFSPRSEESPAPRILDGRDGLLFEDASENRRRIRWMDLESRQEKVLADSAGYNFIH